MLQSIDCSVDILFQKTRLMNYILSLRQLNIFEVLAFIKKQLLKLNVE